MAARFDVVVLDVMLPGMDGFEVMSAMRQAGQFVPTLMLTARGQPEDVLRGLCRRRGRLSGQAFRSGDSDGADQGLLRRGEWLRARQSQTPAPPPDTFTFGDKSVDFGQLELRVRDQVFPADPDGSESASLPDRA